MEPYGHDDIFMSNKATGLVKIDVKIALVCAETNQLNWSAALC